MSAYARTPEHGVFTPPPECAEPNDHRIVRLLKKELENAHKLHSMHVQLPSGEYVFANHVEELLQKILGVKK